MMTYSVGYASAEFAEKAADLARALDLNVNSGSDCCLWLSEYGIGIKFKVAKPFYADFTLDTWKKRRDEGKKLGLVRAIKPIVGMKIIDATAGWGRDAAILASLGAEVLMVERNPIMAIVLQDALDRRDEESKVKLKLSLYAGDALDFLKSLSAIHFPDVIYLDPMHPTRQKSALVKNELQILQNMIGEDTDAKMLLHLARTRVKQKVVVKWPQKTSSLIPTSSFVAGKTIRFDIYTACKN
jgi:16S rRNA (guanine1516-N2)-methyltransferase